MLKKKVAKMIPIITEKQLRRHLKSKTKKELLDEICELSKCYSAINEHYYKKYSSYEMQNSLFVEMMDKIDAEFNPKKGLACPRMEYIKDEIYRYSLKCTYPVLLAHVHLHLASICLGYIVEYRDLVYDSMDNEVYNHLKSFVVIFNDNELILTSEMSGITENIVTKARINKPKIYERLVRIFEKYNFKYDL